MRRFVLPSLALSALLLGACTQVPQRLRGDFAMLEPVQASAGKFNGVSVRWGGIVTGARAVDVGSCIEVAAFPLDRWTLRPVGLSTGAYQHQDSIRPSYYAGAGRKYAAPRFLACGDQLLDRSVFFTGAVITVTGAVEQPFVFEAEPTSCEVNQQRRGQPDYTGTVHIANDDICAVSLPVLKAASAHAWPEPGRNGHIYQNGFDNYPPH
ncbi:MAG: Slp family lipoprotein [Proteobacteria bacterium]|nr:Slp family lipoprotein [Pseudomonadota bacterium]